ncbi:MAG: hypothetical protein ACYTFI_07580 [Planctomycetota bacterium]
MSKEHRPRVFVMLLAGSTAAWIALRQLAPSSAVRRAGEPAMVFLVAASVARSAHVPAGCCTMT